MPVETSIHWKPRHDSHYVLASLQQAGAAFPSVFVEQPVLVRVQEAARAAPVPSVGLLLGHRYICSDSGSPFLLISSLVEQPLANRSETQLDVLVSDLLTGWRAENAIEVLGWYCSKPAHEPGLPAAAASTHKALFPHSYQTALVLSRDLTSAAFLRHDRVDSRWFCAPFYEIAPATQGSDQRKATTIGWQDYTTTADVVQLRPHPTPVADAAEGGEGKPHRSLLRSLFTRSAAAEANVKAVAQPAPKLAPPTTDASADHAPSRARDFTNEVAATQGLESGVIPLLPESADTSSLDSPERYLRVALLEGFFIAGKFAARAGSADETLWILNEPYSSFLLTVVTDKVQVLDAILHYNVHTDDVSLLNSAFPEHRDPASGTLYMRRSCVDGLRALCGRLRATNALHRDWKVGPTIYMLTPGEWELEVDQGGFADDGSSTIETLNRQRLLSLPEAVRSQFRLGPHITDAGEHPRSEAQPPRQDPG